MRCLTPIRIKVPGFSNIWSNFIDGHDENGKPLYYHYDYVPCGKCYRCLANKRLDWVFRLSYELKTASSAWFLTLTYNDLELPLVPFFDSETGASLGYVPSVRKKDIIDFHRRLKRRCPDLRYFLISELGEHTKRPHYHAIYFNLPVDITEVDKLVRECWKKGNIYVGGVSGASINYVAKYCIQPHESSYPNAERMFSLMSTHPAIGSGYLQEFSKWHRNDINRYYLITGGGVKQPLPKYYKDRLYSDEERRKHSEDYRKSICESEPEIKDLQALEKYLFDMSEKAFSVTQKVKEEKRYLTEKISKLSKV